MLLSDPGSILVIALQTATRSGVDSPVHSRHTSASLELIVNS